MLVVRLTCQPIQNTGTTKCRRRQGSCPPVVIRIIHFLRSDVPSHEDISHHDIKSNIMEPNYTPDYSHVLDDPGFRDNVYEPEADTFFLMSCLEKDSAALQQLVCAPLGEEVKNMETEGTKEEEGTTASMVQSSERFVLGATPWCCRHLRVCEVGPGSGLVLSFLATFLAVLRACSCSGARQKKSLLFRPIHFFALDVNDIALAATQETWSRECAARHGRMTGPHYPGSESNGEGQFNENDNMGSAEESRWQWEQRVQFDQRLNAISSDLFSGAKKDAAERSCAACVGNKCAEVDKFDLVVFNPPYVPTSADEFEKATEGRGIEAAWAGGPDGRLVIDRFLQELPGTLRLSTDSICYLLLIRQNNVDDVIDLVETLPLVSVSRGKDCSCSDVVRTSEEESEFPTGFKLKATIVDTKYTGEYQTVVRIGWQQVA